MPPRLYPAVLRRPLISKLTLSAPTRHPFIHPPPHRQFFNLPQNHRYNRFSNVQNIKYQWSKNPNFRYGTIIVGCGIAIFYLLNLERVPISDRLRFNCIPAAWEREMGKQMYAELIREYQGRILPPGHPASKMVKKVMERLVPVCGLEGEEWDVAVIADDKMINASVLPG